MEKFQQRKDLPVFRKSEEVRGIKIARVILTDNKWEIVPKESEYENVFVTHEWYMKYLPMTGDYLVIQSDGSVSCMKEAYFEKCYRAVYQ